MSKSTQPIIQSIPSITIIVASPIKVFQAWLKHAKFTSVKLNLGTTNKTKQSLTKLAVSQISNVDSKQKIFFSCYLNNDWVKCYYFILGY